MRADRTEYLQEYYSRPEVKARCRDNANMSPEATKYAELPDTWSKEQCYEWMEAVQPQERDIDPEFP